MSVVSDIQQLTELRNEYVVLARTEEVLSNRDADVRGQLVWLWSGRRG